MANYQDYLRSSHWQDVKRRYRASNLPQTCRVCGNLPVNLHHRSYKRIGRERLSDLIPLCSDHHHAAHQFHNQAKARQPKTALWNSTNKYVRRQNKARQRAGQRAQAKKERARKRDLVNAEVQRRNAKRGSTGG